MNLINVHQGYHWTRVAPLVGVVLITIFLLSLNATLVQREDGFNILGPLLRSALRDKAFNPAFRSTPIAPHRITYLWPRPAYELSAHPKLPDRPHKIVLGPASYTLGFGDLTAANATTRIRVLTFMQWIYDWEEGPGSGLAYDDMVNMGRQCFVCFSESNVRNFGDAATKMGVEEWHGVRVNGSSAGHPFSESKRAKEDLTCIRFNTSHSKEFLETGSYETPSAGGIETVLVYECEVPSSLLQKAKEDAHIWVSLIDHHWTRKELDEHFTDGETKSLTYFTAVVDMTPITETAQVGKGSSTSHNTSRDTSPLRLSGCHTTPLFQTAQWPQSMRLMLVEHLAWNKLNGMRKLRMYYLPDEEIAPWLLAVFDYFGRDGFLELYEWRLPEGLWVAYYGQRLLQFDCLYRSAVDSDWTLFSDFDELAASNTPALQSWDDLFGNYFLDPTIGSIQLRSWFFLGNCAIIGRSLLNLISSSFVYREATAQGHYIRSKYWVRPSKASASFVHQAGGFAAGFKEVVMDPYRAHMRHYFLSRDLVPISNCTHANMAESGLIAEYGFPLAQQTMLSREVEAATLYIESIANVTSFRSIAGLGVPLMEVSRLV